jgi:hypothetical protein
LFLSYGRGHLVRVLDKRVLRNTFGPKSKKHSGDNLKSLMIYTHSPNIILVIKSRKIEGEEHVVSMRKNRNVYRNMLGKLEGKQDRQCT